MVEKPWIMPAEWSTNRAFWLAWPKLEKEWGAAFEAAKRSTLELAQAISSKGKGELVHLLVPSAEHLKPDRWPSHVLPIHLPYGDTWLRDTGPLFVSNGKEVAGTCFKFNGWGEQYNFEGDRKTASAITQFCNLPLRDINLVLEGGAIEVDGVGTAITTKQCVLNPNRNPNLSKAEIRAALFDALGLKKVLWLNTGLKNDHTHGHVDTLVRFCNKAKVIVMEPYGDDDPNKQTFLDINHRLSNMTDADEQKLTLVKIPSPGKIEWRGVVQPASYVNFVITNKKVIVPMYGSKADPIALKIISEQFPKRETVGLDANAILSGGGAFHCITKQEPVP